MAYTTIDDPTAYFQTKLYTGNGSTQSITLDGLNDMQPDWVWVKQRGGTTNHKTSDSVRGATKALQNNDTDAEATDTDGITSFDSNGFSLGAGGDYNSSSASQVAWNWKETATAGFDILTYEGSGSAKTVSHNLGVKPDWIMVKNIDSTDPAFNWRSYHSALGAGIAMKPNGTDAESDDPGYWNDTEPTSSVFSVKDSGETNNSSQTYIAYLFAEKQGYSKFGSYTGNGNADGTFVYTGFKVGWFMLKKTSATDPWLIYDNKRSPINQVQANLQANSSNAEVTNTVYLDFLSNGVKFRNTDNDGNLSGGSYIYMAFAENPFVTSTGVPATAR